MSIALQLTDSGRYLLALALAGENLKFTKLAIGSGAEPDSAAALTALVNTQIEMAIESYTTGSNYITLKASFDNSDISEGFNWTETGVYVQDEDGSDVLYAYCNEGSSYTYVPAETEGKLLSTSISLAVTIDDAENITVNLGDNGTFALKSELSEALKGLVPANYIIASSDTPDELKKHANYVCDLLDTDSGSYTSGIKFAIENGLTALGATGGKIVILPGTYTEAYTIGITADNVTIEGFGDATQLKSEDSTSWGITISGNHNRLRNFSYRHDTSSGKHNALILEGNFNIIEGVTLTQTTNSPIIDLESGAYGNVVMNCYLLTTTSNDEECIIANYSGGYLSIINCYAFGLENENQTHTYYSLSLDWLFVTACNLTQTETEPS